jgi:hypothetical protein
MLIAVILLSVLSAVLGYLVYVNYKKAEQATLYCESYVRFISAIYFRFRNTRDHIKEVDRLGSFQADDEVGFIFKEIDQSVDDLYTFITRYVNTDTKDEKDEKAED